MWRRGLLIFGWVLIGLSPLPWLGIVTLPLWGLDSLAEGAGWAIGLLLAAEALFLVGAAIVGPSVYRQRHVLWAKLTGRPPPSDPPPDERGRDERP